jgi:RNA polymerase sigma-70 factor (ECF subfamily)
LGGVHPLPARNGGGNQRGMSDNDQIEAQQAGLLRRIAAGDSAALGEFHDQTASSLYSFAVRMLNDPHDAEEVIQDVFVQIWTKAQSFDPAVGIAFHWAMSIVRNRCIDRLRSRQRRARVIIERENSDAIEAAAETFAAETSLAPDELESVRAALGALPDEQRQAIEMAFFGGLSHHEIAVTLNEPLGTIKARIRRGMLKLREGLEVCL